MVRASDETLARTPQERLGVARDRVDGAGGEVRRFQGLGRMEPPGLAVAAHTSPVVDPERGIGHLLDLDEHDPRTDRMHRPRRNQDAVARAGLEPVEQGLDRAGLHCLGQVVPPYTRPESGIDQAPRLGMEDHPGFGLAVVSGQPAPAAPVIIRMDLDRKDLVGIQELHQERKLVAPRDSRPQERRAPITGQGRAACSLRGAVRHPADVIAMVGDLPN